MKLTRFVPFTIGLLATVSHAQAQAKAAISQTFEFHSGFWVNLHHFLYWNAQATSADHRVALNPSDTDELKRLSPGEQKIWNAAVAYYRHSMIQRDLLFDDGMIEIKNRLEDAESSPDLAGVAIPADLKAVFVNAAPVYRKHFWPRQNALNREWIARLQPLIAKYGDGIRSALVRIYEEPWPARPVRVDVVAYANWAGGYTTLEPTRTTISSTNAAYQGPAALEMVFHEGSHGMVERVMDAIEAAEKAVNQRRPAAAIHFPRELWHEVLFYTSGELVAERIPGYVPFADKNGLWAGVWRGPDRALIARDWTPHMDGKAGLRQSLTKLVHDLASPSGR